MVSKWIVIVAPVEGAPGKHEAFAVRVRGDGGSNGHGALRTTWKVVALAAVLLVHAVVPAGAGNAWIVGPVQEVVDGDTIRVDGVELDLWEVKAPELGQACREADGSEYDCGEAAKWMLKAMLADRRVICEILDHREDGRAVAHCLLGQLDLGELLVMTGWAVDARQRGGGVYASEEADALMNKRRMWEKGIQLPTGHNQEKSQ